MGCIGDIYRVRIILEVDVRIQLVSRDIGDVVGQSKLTSAKHVPVQCGSLLWPIGVRHVRKRIGMLSGPKLAMGRHLRHLQYFGQPKIIKKR